MDKLKAFFQNKVTKIVLMSICAVSAGGLILGGITTESINGLIVAVGVVISAVSALIAYIAGKVK
jgi:hypothetical protein